jgi:hypothetical protein
MHISGGGGATGTQNADFWAAKASEILRCYLLAAALEGHGMGQVMAWALHPQDRTPAGLLSQYGPSVPAGWLGTLEQNLAAAPNTRSGYFAALAPAVAFMDNPTVARACRPDAGEGFDIAAYIRSPGSAPSCSPAKAAATTATAAVQAGGSRTGTSAGCRSARTRT